MISDLLVNIANKVKSLKDDAVLAYTTISNKGFEVPENKTVANLPNTISSMPNNGSLQITGGIILDESVMLSGELDLLSIMVNKNYIKEIDSNISAIPAYFMNPLRPTKTMLNRVNLPNVTSITGYAFLNCTKMHTCNLPAATTIGTNAFQNCYSLTSIDLPVAISISSYAFHGCVELTSVNLPAATSIGNYAFYNCSSLTSVNLPAATTIQANAFSNCSSLTSIDLPAAAFSSSLVSSNTYANCLNLRQIKILKAKYVTANMFNGCVNLIDLHIGAAFTANQNFSTAKYNPVEAMDDVVDTLVEEGETFATNNEKWNYNLREHFAANLTNRSSMSTKYTLTFGATVLAAMTDETKKAFTSKGWTLA